MTFMDDNPYTPPVSASVAEANPSQWPTNRYARAGLVGFETWLGVSVSLGLFWEVFEAHGLFAEVAVLYLLCCVAIGMPFSVAMVWWTWRSPTSKLPCSVANTVIFTPFILSLVFLFLGMK
jgi:hypothetical protein